MSFSIYDYPPTQRAAEAEREREYAARYECHARGCGDPEDAKACDDCGRFFCPAHLVLGTCLDCCEEQEVEARELDALAEETTGISVEGIAEPLADAIRGFLKVHDAIARATRSNGRRAA
jgi:hypothetical protein